MSKTLYRYNLPMVTGDTRTGLVLEVEGRFCDIAPLPGFSRETVEDVVEAIKNLPDAESVETWPRSVRFGFEQVFGTHADAGYIPVNAFLGAVCDVNANDIERARDYPAVKVKVGRDALDNEIAAVRCLRETLPAHVDLRLDANRAWALDDALRFANGVDGIAYIEEPLRNPAQLAELAAGSDIPLALDETVVEHADNPDILDTFPPIAAVVLKPTLLGGLVPTMSWSVAATIGGITPVISACFESGLGIVALAELAAVYTEGVPAGLDTYHYLAEDILPGRLDFENGLLDLKRARALVKAFDPSGLEVVYRG